MNRQDTILTMNLWGKRNNPFIFMVGYDMESCLVMSPDEALGEGILFDFNGYKNHKETVVQNLPKITHSTPIDYSTYLKAFSYVQKELNRGNSYLVNLTFPTPISLEGTLEDVFHFNNALFRLLYKDEFIVFSPERFVRIQDGKIYTHPMKGTINASIENAREIILNNPKEQAEHATIVDLLRNDLSRFATGVTVDRYRYIEPIKSNNRELLQVSSEISGTLPPGYISKLGDIIFSLLPAGSITGAPKQKTREIITKAENYTRGYYTGIAGYYEDGRLESCVLIRFIERKNDHYVYKSGGGITSQSDAEEEYRELIDKIYVPTD